MCLFFFTACLCPLFFFFFFFNDTATTEIYTLSLHDALPISRIRRRVREREGTTVWFGPALFRHFSSVVAIRLQANREDRKSTRLNSSHSQISYAVFCLKKKKKKKHFKTYKTTLPLTTQQRIS